MRTPTPRLSFCYILGDMGRQWLHAKRLVAGLKKAKTNTKLVREITIAARTGRFRSGDERPAFCSHRKGKKESVPKDAIQRAINKGAGIGDDKLTMEHVVYEGRAPHNVPVIVEVYTDNVNRTAPEIRVLFRKGQLASSGANKFVFDKVGLVEAHHPDANIDLEAAAIEAGANEVQPLTHEQNDDIPKDAAGAKFICERTEVATVSKWLSANGWTVDHQRNRLHSESSFRTDRSPAGGSRRVPARTG